VIILYLPAQVIAPCGADERGKDKDSRKNLHGMPFRPGYFAAAMTVISTFTLCSNFATCTKVRAG